MRHETGQYAQVGSLIEESREVVEYSKSLRSECDALEPFKSKLDYRELMSWDEEPPDGLVQAESA
jgi:hypothetical protein